LIPWAVAGIPLWFTPRFTSVKGFVVSVSHFVERHGLIVIVALGETIVVIGTGPPGLALNEGLVLVELETVRVIDIPEETRLRYRVRS
jgi:low temperature requirement protein LtrA